MPQFAFITGHYDDEDNQVITWSNYSRSVSTRTTSNRLPWQGRFGHLDLDSGYSDWSNEWGPNTEYYKKAISWGNAVIAAAATLPQVPVRTVPDLRPVFQLVPWEYRPGLPQ